MQGDNLKKLILAIALIILLLASCTTTKAAHSTNPVYVTNTKKVYLLPPEAMEGRQDNVQLLNGSFGEQTFGLIVYLQADSNGIFMSLLNDFGTDMGSLSYDGRQVDFQSSVFPANLKAEYILLDIQNAYYKKQNLEKLYNDVGLNFEEVVRNNKSVRRIMNKDKVIEEITITENFIKITNVLRGYEYNLSKGEE